METRALVPLFTRHDEYDFTNERKRNSGTYVQISTWLGAGKSTKPTNIHPKSIIVNPVRSERTVQDARVGPRHMHIARSQGAARGVCNFLFIYIPH